MEDFQYDFFMSRIEHIRDIKENDKIKISLVFYEGVQGPCIFKTCKNRNLLDVCDSLKDIRHPNIVVIHDYLYADNNTYIIEEYIDGATIKDLLEQNGCFSVKKTVCIMQEVCNGLEILHKQKPPIVHNDINTSNIMIRQDGSVKIFDFDISRTYKEGVKQNTRLFGTEEYAAPEHYGYGQSEPRTDIYSLGVTMHEMLTGKNLDDQHKATYKGKLKKIISKCTQIDLNKRYSSVTNLKKDLKKLYCINFKLFLVMLIFILLLFIMKSFGSDHVQTGNNMKQPSDINTSIQSGNAISEQNKQKVEESLSELIFSNIENNQEAEKENSHVISEIETDTTIAPSKMSTICEITGLISSMVALNDGTIVYLEEQKYDNCYLKDSLGQEKFLDFSTSRFKLGYDGYKDTLYLFADFGDYLSVHLIDKELQLEKVADVKLIPDWNGYREEHRDVRFYSDGIVDISAHLIDTNTWLVVGESESYDAIINDSSYYIYLDSADEQYRFIHEVDDSGEAIQTVQIPEHIQTQSLDVTPGYQNCGMFYFIGFHEDKQIVYGFDGEKLSNIICLNDYKYYSDIVIEDWCVTKDRIWIYDDLTDTIKEFLLK